MTIETTQEELVGGDIGGKEKARKKGTVSGNKM